MKSIKKLYNYKDFKAAFIKGNKEWHEQEWKNFILTIKQRAGNELILLFRDKMDEIVKLSPSSEDKFYKGLGKAMELIKIKYKI